MRASRRFPAPGLRAVAERVGQALTCAVPNTLNSTRPRRSRLDRPFLRWCDEILEVFGPYRPDKMTAGLAEQNLRAKIADDEFRSDLDAYLTEPPAAYNVEGAAELVITNVLRKL